MTRCLDIDVGNTRLKWRCQDERGESAAREIPYLEEAPTRIRISCVAGAEARRHLAGELRDAYGVTAEFASATAVLAGVRSAYDEPERLGVDRWLALVAGWNRRRAATMVVDLGTAATVDFVHANGQHEGGYIVPGLSLMARALAQDTADVRIAGELAGELAPGRNTAHAVRRGTTIMLLEFVESCVAGFRQRCEDDPVVFLTGGDADALAHRLSFQPIHEPDLVLEGLRYALP